jgi:hypothetical protein
LRILIVNPSDGSVEVLSDVDVLYDVIEEEESVDEVIIILKGDRK